MATAEPKLASLARHDLIRLSDPIRRTLAGTPYTPPEGATVSVKSMLESLLPPPNPQSPSPPLPSSEEARREVRDFCLCCAALASAEGEESPYVYWIPRDLSLSARSALRELSGSVLSGEERESVCGLMPDLLPFLKGVIKESCVDTESDDFVASSAKTPVAYTIVAAHQFRWLVTQVSYPYLGKLCSLVIPCALTVLDHWSPEVKGQGMVSFIHLAKNVNSAELGWYEDPIFDACCRNIASSDELWHLVVEMSVHLLTCILRRNPRSAWYEQILSEMLGHLERQPMNKEHRISWLLHVEPVLNAMGLVLLAHFRRIFSLLFQWMHADDDKTLLLVLDRVHMIVKLTWIRKSPLIERLVDELTLVYKEASMRKEREAIRTRICHIFILLRKCMAMQFETAWEKHRDDPNLTPLLSFITEAEPDVLSMRY